MQHNPKINLAIAIVAIALMITTVSAANGWRIAMPMIFVAPSEADQQATAAAQRDANDAAQQATAMAHEYAIQATEQARQMEQEQAERATQQALGEAATATIQALTDSGCTSYTPSYGAVPNMDPNDPEYYVQLATSNGGVIIVPTWYNVSYYQNDTWQTLKADATMIEQDSYLIAARYQFSIIVCPKV